MRRWKRKYRAGDPFQGPAVRDQVPKGFNISSQDIKIDGQLIWKMVQAWGFRYVSQGKYKLQVDSQVSLGYFKNFIQARTNKNEDS